MLLLLYVADLTRVFTVKKTYSFNKTSQTAEKPQSVSTAASLSQSHVIASANLITRAPQTAAAVCIERARARQKIKIK